MQPYRRVPRAWLGRRRGLCQVAQVAVDHFSQAARDLVLADQRALSTQVANPNGYSVDDIGPPAVRRKLAQDRVAASDTASHGPARAAADAR